VLRTVNGVRYLNPLREGGSLPAVVEADDEGTYVVKFRSAGQGTAALVAEIVVGEIGRQLSVRVPELVVLEVGPDVPQDDSDEEVKDLLAASVGRNLGMDFLPGSRDYDGEHEEPPPAEAARILWLDAFTANVDRTWSNPNLLTWHRTLWAIDHGAALVFQHAWPSVESWAGRRFDFSQHILREVALDLSRAELADLDLALAAELSDEVLAGILELVPNEWLTSMNSLREPNSAAGLRERYAQYLRARLESGRHWWPAVLG